MLCIAGLCYAAPAVQLPDGTYVAVRDGETAQQAYSRAQKMYPDAFEITLPPEKKMDMDWYSITTLQALPNTPIYDSMVEQGLIEPVGSQEVRFNSGGYGKQNEIDLGLRMASQDFEEAFRSIPMDSIPTESQLQDIWFFMNYHLNFHRLFGENRPRKIEQQLSNLKALSDVISPEHGLALYFIGFLQYKTYGKIDEEIISRLELKIEESDYWRQRFKAFGLSVNDLKTCNFKNKEIPRMLPGNIPQDELSEAVVIEFRKN
jgi:hypothetical protein